MADSTTFIDTILSSQGQKEVTANAYMDASSPASWFGRRSATAGLNWRVYGVARWYINATATVKANSEVALTDASTRYVSVNRSLTVSQVATAFDTDKLALHRCVTSGGAVTSFEDHRDPHHVVRFLYGRFTLAMGGASKVLTYEQAMCESMELTGNSASLLDVTVPTIPRIYIVYANTTGGGGIRVKTAAGTGITIADTKRAIVECDGTNVVRITADA